MFQKPSERFVASSLDWASGAIKKKDTASLAKAASILSEQLFSAFPDLYAGAPERLFYKDCPPLPVKQRPAFYMVAPLLVIADRLAKNENYLPNALMALRTASTFVNSDKELKAQIAQKIWRGAAALVTRQVQEGVIRHADVTLPYMTNHLPNIHDIFMPQQVHTAPYMALVKYAAHASLDHLTLHATPLGWNIFKRELQINKIPTHNWPRKAILDDDGTSAQLMDNCFRATPAVPTKDEARLFCEKFVL